MTKDEAAKELKEHPNKYQTQLNRLCFFSPIPDKTCTKRCASYIEARIANAKPTSIDGYYSVVNDGCSNPIVTGGISVSQLLHN